MNNRGAKCLFQINEKADVLALHVIGSWPDTAVSKIIIQEIMTPKSLSW